MTVLTRLFLAFLSCTPFLGFAQPDDSLPEARRQQLEAMKAAFFTRRLALDPAEAKRFWPVYDEYTRKQEANRQKLRQLQMRMRNDAILSNDRELEQLANEYARLRADEASLMSQYHAQFMEVLPVRKVLALYRAEEEWKMRLIEEIRSRRAEQVGPRGGYRP